MAESMIIIGRKGIEPTTHCYKTGRPLKKAPINYSLGDNWYISVNAGHCLSTEQINQVKEELNPFLETDDYKDLDEVPTNDN
jgi:hypothetical protein